MQLIKSHIFYYKSRENPYQYYKSHENPYQVLQVMYAGSERAMKSKVCIIKSLFHSTKLHQKKYHEFVAICTVTSVHSYYSDYYEAYKVLWKQYSTTTDSKVKQCYLCNV